MREFQLVKDNFRKKENNYDNFKLPQRATEKSSGYDFFNNLNKDIVVKAGEKYTYWTDIKYVSQARQEFLMIIPRSSLGIKKDMRLANTVGDIDIDYANNISNDGNIAICIKNDGTEDLVIPKGQAIAQGIIVNFNIVDNDVPKSIERTGGIGSTTI
ncbi:MAG: hypothetical protein IJ880_05460 [Bacilli bacterium]|nr:hypothetical protein [Bacilli bacterium]